MPTQYFQRPDGTTYGVIVAQGETVTPEEAEQVYSKLVARANVKRAASPQPEEGLPATAIGQGRTPTGKQGLVYDTSPGGQIGAVNQTLAAMDAYNAQARQAAQTRMAQEDANAGPLQRIANFLNRNVGDLFYGNPLAYAAASPAERDLMQQASHLSAGQRMAGGYESPDFWGNVLSPEGAQAAQQQTGIPGALARFGMGMATPSNAALFAGTEGLGGLAGGVSRGLAGYAAETAQAAREAEQMAEAVSALRASEEAARLATATRLAGSGLQNSLRAYVVGAGALGAGRTALNTPYRQNDPWGYGTDIALNSLMAGLGAYGLYNSAVPTVRDLYAERASMPSDPNFPSTFRPPTGYSGGNVLGAASPGIPPPGPGPYGASDPASPEAYEAGFAPTPEMPPGGPTMPPGALLPGRGSLMPPPPGEGFVAAPGGEITRATAGPRVPTAYPNIGPLMPDQLSPSTFGGMTPHQGQGEAPYGRIQLGVQPTGTGTGAPVSSGVPAGMPGMQRADAAPRSPVTATGVQAAQLSLVNDAATALQDALTHSRRVGSPALRENYTALQSAVQPFGMTLPAAPRTGRTAFYGQQLERATRQLEATFGPLSQYVPNATEATPAGAEPLSSANGTNSPVSGVPVPSGMPPPVSAPMGAKPAGTYSAPVAQAAVPEFVDRSADHIVGSSGVTYTPDNTPVPFHYAVLPVEELITSHTDALVENPNYDQEMQERDRERAASGIQIAELRGKGEPARLHSAPTTADGAPLIGRDNQVESGNARSISLRQDYQENGAWASRYRQALLARAADFGLDPQLVDKIAHPVLVRVSDMQHLDIEARRAFAREAGKPTVAAMSAVEKAASDGKTLMRSGALALYDPSAGLTSRAQLPFVRAWMKNFSPAEAAALLNPDGSLSMEGLRRVQNALLTAAYDDPATIERLIGNPDPEIKGVGNALAAVAPKMAAMKYRISKGERFPLDPTAELTEAANELTAIRKAPYAEEQRGVRQKMLSDIARLKERGQEAPTLRHADLSPEVAYYLDNTAAGSIFGEEDTLSPLARDLLQLLDRNRRSSGKIARVLDTYADIVDAAGSPQEHRLEPFVGSAVPTREQVLATAEEAALGTQSQQPDLFGGPEDGLRASQPPVGVRPASETETGGDLRPAELGEGTAPASGHAAAVATEPRPASEGVVTTAAGSAEPAIPGVESFTPTQADRLDDPFSTFQREGAPQGGEQAHTSSPETGPLAFRVKTGTITHTLYISRNGMDILRGVLRIGSVNGLHLRPTEISEIKWRIAEAKRGAYNSQEKAFLDDFVSQLQAIWEKTGDRGAGLVEIKYGDRRSDMRNTVVHESIHGGQTQLGQGHPAGAVVWQTLSKHPVFDKLTRGLNRIGYPADPSVTAVEGPAWIGAGQWERLGLTEEEALDFLDHYTDALTQEHGPDALDTVFRHSSLVRRTRHGQQTGTLARTETAGPSQLSAPGRSQTPRREGGVSAGVAENLPSRRPDDFTRAQLPEPVQKIVEQAKDRARDYALDSWSTLGRLAPQSEGVTTEYAASNAQARVLTDQLVTKVLDAFPDTPGGQDNRARFYTYLVQDSIEGLRARLTAQLQNEQDPRQRKELRTWLKNLTTLEDPVTGHPVTDARLRAYFQGANAKPMQQAVQAHKDLIEPLLEQNYVESGYEANGQRGKYTDTFVPKIAVDENGEPLAQFSGSGGGGLTKPKFQLGAVPGAKPFTGTADDYLQYYGEAIGLRLRTGLRARLERQMYAQWQRDGIAIEPDATDAMGQPAVRRIRNDEGIPQLEGYFTLGGKSGWEPASEYVVRRSPNGSKVDASLPESLILPNRILKEVEPLRDVLRPTEGSNAVEAASEKLIRGFLIGLPHAAYHSLALTSRLSNARNAIAPRPEDAGDALARLPYVRGLFQVKNVLPQQHSDADREKAILWASKNGALPPHFGTKITLRGVDRLKHPLRTVYEGTTSFLYGPRGVFANAATTLYKWVDTQYGVSTPQGQTVLRREMQKLGVFLSARQPLIQRWLNMIPPKGAWGTFYQVGIRNRANVYQQPLAYAAALILGGILLREAIRKAAGEKAIKLISPLDRTLTYPAQDIERTAAQAKRGPVPLVQQIGIEAANSFITPMLSGPGASSLFATAGTIPVLEPTEENGLGVKFVPSEAARNKVAGLRRLGVIAQGFAPGSEQIYDFGSGRALGGAATLAPPAPMGASSGGRGRRARSARERRGR